MIAALAWLFAASVKASLVILVVVVAQWLLRDHVPAKWRYLMWLLVFARLMFPVAPQSPLSVFNVVRYLAPQTRVEMRALEPRAGTPVLLIPAPRPAASMAISRTDALGAVRWITGLWILVAGALTFRLIFSSVRLHRRVARFSVRCLDPAIRELLEECKRDLEIRADVQILETDLVSAPALHGIVRPKLLMPHRLLETFEPAELRFVFLHELAHLRRRDVLVNWVITTIQIVYWFHPLVWLATVRIREERELACDELALDCLQQDERPQYGRTILKLLQMFRNPAPLPAVLGILSDKHQMKRRLTMISRFRSPSRTTFMFLALVLALATVSLTDASAGEGARTFVKRISPEAHATLEKMHGPISFGLTSVTLSDFIQEISRATGVPISQEAALLSSPLQLRRFSVKADQAPGDIALIETLSALGLGFKAEENSITVTAEGGPRRMIIARDHDLPAEPGKRVLVDKFEIRTHDGEDHMVEVEGDSPSPEVKAAIEELEKEGVIPGEVKKRVFIHKRHDDVDMEKSADGGMKRTLKLRRTIDGVETTGTLEIELLP